MKSAAIDCRTFRIPINFKNCTVVKIDTKPPLFYMQGYGAFLLWQKLFFQEHKKFK